MADIQTLTVGETQLTTNIGSLQFVVGVPQEFEFSTVAGANAGTMVVGNSEFNDPEAIEKLEYFEVQTQTWNELSGDGGFGGSTGFPLGDMSAKFRVTFKASGTYTFTAYIKTVDGDSRLAETSATANVRDYVKVSLESDFETKTFEAETPGEFTISVTPNDDLNVKVVGKLEFTKPCAIEVKVDGTYQESTGTFDSMVLEQETLEFRVSFSEAGETTMNFAIEKDSQEYVSLSQNVNVAEKVVDYPDVEITADQFVTGVSGELFINVTANDFDGQNKKIKYVFSQPEAIEHLEQYISDESSDQYGKWVVVDPSNLMNGEMRTIKNETIQFKVTFLNAGDFNLKVLIDEQECGSFDMSVSKPPVEPVEEIEISVIQKPDTSNVSIDQTQGKITFAYPENADNEFWKSYFESSTSDDSENVYFGVRFTAPEQATKWEIVFGDETKSDEFSDGKSVDWFFAIGKFKDDAFTKSDITSYSITVRFYADDQEMYNKEFTVDLVDSGSGEEPDQPEENTPIKYLLYYLNHLAEDVITMYGFDNGWSLDEINENTSKYGENFGAFALDFGLVPSEVEKIFVNYTNHYTLKDSILRLAIDDLEQSREDFEEVLQSVPEGLETVIEKLGTSVNVSVEVATPDADLSKPDENIVLTASEDPITGKKDISGKSIVVKSLNADSASVNMVSEGNVTIRNYEATGELKKSTSNAQLKINTPGNINISSSNMNMKGYNCIEIGLTKTIDLPEIINISGIDFSEVLSNNAILIFGTNDNAVINISDCHFGNVSNALRLSNRTNAKNVTVNISNCIVDSWDSDPQWAGFIIMQDYTSGSLSAEESNNLFAPDKITLNILNCYGPNGKKIMASDLSKVCGTSDENQLIYVWNSKGGTIQYGDGSRYPKINFA